MTIFGVAGAASLLTAGLGVQASIGQINDRQFEDLIHYDMIVAEKSDNNDEQRAEVAKAMKGGAVSESAPIYYEEMSKVAGKENDKQSIILIATDDAYNFGDYITLRSRTGHKPQVLTDRGAIISERMAEMMDAKVGDTITVTDSSGTERKVRVDGITEMLYRAFHVHAFGWL